MADFDIFVSYAHEDTEQVRPLIVALEAARWRVFWDRTILPGGNWRAFLTPPLATSPVVIVAWSKHSIESLSVQSEADSAVRRGALIPVLLEDVVPPVLLDQIQAADLTTWLANDDTSLPPLLKEAIKKRIEGSTGYLASSEKPIEALAPGDIVSSRSKSRRPSAEDGESPSIRRLWVYARDPLMSSDLTFFELNEVQLSVIWENDLRPGPVGEYLEIVDVDPTSGGAYVPVDLNQPTLRQSNGYKPTEGNPQFHQQMVYAVAMKTIENFEKALGRVTLWPPRYADIGGERRLRFVRRLRIYPHALREPLAYYSPIKCALLFGYFNAAETFDQNLPGGLVFNCLSHDVVAHETTHALLDGLHPRYKEPVFDMLPFHEAFADIVALFQHFTIRPVLRAAIRQARGRDDLSGRLADLAVQFGDAIGAHGALRSAIRKRPKRDDYATSTEPHARGSLLVAAVFSVFTRVYDRKTRDLFLRATKGTGILPNDAIPDDLVNELADEAASIARIVLTICIRALDYCPPVDLTFGEYLRALLTADRDLIADDVVGYRVAFIQAFRERGIHPSNVLNFSVDTLTWQFPDFAPITFAPLSLAKVEWRRDMNRYKIFETGFKAAAGLYMRVFDNPSTEDSLFAALGLVRSGSLGQPGREVTIDGERGVVSRISIESVRPTWREGPTGGVLSDVIIQLTQAWTPANFSGYSLRGGCTIISDLDTGRVRYVIRKRVGNRVRSNEAREHHSAFTEPTRHNAYFTDYQEPFAMLHRDA